MTVVRSSNADSAMTRVWGEVRAISRAARGPPPAGMLTSIRATSGCSRAAIEAASSASAAVPTSVRLGSWASSSDNASRRAGSSSATNTRTSTSVSARGRRALTTRDASIRAGPGNSTPAGGDPDAADRGDGGRWIPDGRSGARPVRPGFDRCAAAQDLLPADRLGGSPGQRRRLPRGVPGRELRRLGPAAVRSRRRRHQRVPRRPGCGVRRRREHGEHAGGLACPRRRCRAAGGVGGGRRPRRDERGCELLVRGQHDRLLPAGPGRSAAGRPRADRGLVHAALPRRTRTASGRAPPDRLGRVARRSCLRRLRRIAHRSTARCVPRWRRGPGRGRSGSSETARASSEVALEMRRLS